MKSNQVRILRSFIMLQRIGIIIILGVVHSHLHKHELDFGLVELPYARIMLAQVSWAIQFNQIAHCGLAQRVVEDNVLGSVYLFVGEREGLGTRNCRASSRLYHFKLLT